MDAVVGRDGELAVIKEALDAAAGRLAAVVIEGEAGIGKSALLRHVVARLPAGTVLGAHPVEAETQLAFAALADLLEPVPPEAIAGLPQPQRVALEVALLRSSPVGAPPNSRVIGTAVRSVLGRLAERGPVVLVVDDVQWLDRASETALSFALRRLDEQPIRLLVTARTATSGSVEPFGLGRVLNPGPRHLLLGPLTLSALFQMIRLRTGLVLPRPMLQRIEEASGGNPLFALELARALAKVGARPGPGDPLPVPDSLAGLIGSQLAACPAEWSETLLATALSADPTTAMLDRASDAARPAVAGLQASGLIEVSDNRIRFAHPLFATGVLRATPAEQHRAMHRRLALLHDDLEQRARHLALGAEGADEQVAQTLTEAANHASSRGAPEVGAELMAMACDQTPDQSADPAMRRRLARAELEFRAGDAGAAARLVAEVVTDAGVSPPTRAEALELDARLLHVIGTTQRATARCEEALQLVGDDARLLARIHTTRALVEYQDIPAARRHAQLALDLLSALDDPDPVVEAQAVVAFAQAEVELGHPIPWAAVDRGLALEEVAPSASVSDRLSAALGAWLKYRGRLDEAREWLSRTRQAVIDEGDEGSLPYALSHLPQLELWAGNWPLAEQFAWEHLDAAERTGQQAQLISALLNLALVHTHQGRFDEADQELDRAFTVSAHLADDWSVMPLSATRGFLYLSRGDPAAAVEHLGTAVRLYEAWGGANMRRDLEFLAEALLATDAVAEAERVIDRHEERVRPLDHSAALAGVLRCRALLAAARQRLDDATGFLDAALVEHQRSDEPFARARTLLVLGQVRRRRGERKSAVVALEEAERIFAALGAPTWAARAAQERRRVPVRRSSGADLTPAEERVAALVARGLTNPEVAAELFISQKTVEANLTRIYTKLGVRSRAELAARRAQDAGR